MQYLLSHRKRNILSCVSVKMCSYQFCFYIVFIANVILVQLIVNISVRVPAKGSIDNRQTMPLLFRLRIFDFSSRQHTNL